MQGYKNREESEFAGRLWTEETGKTSLKRPLSLLDLESWTSREGAVNAQGRGSSRYQAPRPRAGSVRHTHYLETLPPEAAHFWSLLTCAHTHAPKVTLLTRKPGVWRWNWAHLGGGQGGPHRTRKGCFVSSTKKNAL